MMGRFRATVEHLLNAVEDKDERRFRVLLDRGKPWDWASLSGTVDGSGDTVLMALCRKQLVNSVRLLLKESKDADKFDVNVVHRNGGVSALLIGAQSGNPELMKLLALDPRTDLTIPGNLRRTFLHECVLKLGTKVGTQLEQWEFALLEVLDALDKDFDVDAMDSRGCTALYLAVKIGARVSVCLALRQFGASLDVECDIDSSTVRSLLETEQNLGQIKKAFIDRRLYEQVTKSTSWLQRTLYAIGCNNLQAFEKLMEDADEARAHATEKIAGRTMLLLAAANGRVLMFNKLLEFADIRDVDDNQFTCLHWAAYHGNPGIIQTILNNRDSSQILNLKNDAGLTPLLLLMKKQGRGTEEDYEKSLDLLLRINSVNVNVQDDQGRTALHCAVDVWNNAIVLKLLKRGAKMWIMDRDGEVPLSKIPPQLLTTYFDDHCINVTNSSKYGMEDFELSLNYSFLLPKNEELPSPETSCLWWITQNPTHLDLLRHPVLRLFLHFKWQKISKVFALHCSLYAIYLAFLFVYLVWGAFPVILKAEHSPEEPVDCFKVSLTYNGSTHDLQNAACEIAKTEENVNKVENYLELLSPTWNVVRVILIVLNTLVLLLEFMQFLVSPFRYIFCSLVNILELAMVLSVYAFLWNGDVNVGRLTGVSSLLLSLTEFTRIFGQMPVISTYVKMFTTIAGKFLKFFLWYVVLVVVYSFSFLLLFHPSSEFSSPLGSLMKTVAMLTGEFGFENLPFDQYSIVSQLTFVSFVFFVTIVLLNLLTGLAVGETQRIQEKAELMGYMSQIKLCFYIESMLLRDPDGILGMFDMRKKLIKFTNALCLLKVSKVLSKSRRQMKMREKGWLDSCPILGRILQKIGSSNAVLKPLSVNSENDLLQLKIQDGPFQRVNSESSEDIAIFDAKITLRPFEDLACRVSEPYDTLALVDEEAENLNEYVKQNILGSEEETDSLEELKTTIQELNRKLDNLIAKQLAV